jgi:hypothetical protein
MLPTTFKEYIVTCWWLDTGFGLIVGFIWLFITRDYTVQICIGQGTSYLSLEGLSSSGIWCRVVLWMSTDVSEEHTASIFSVEKISSLETSKQVASRIMLATCMLAEPIYSTLKMEAICSSETSVKTQRTIRHHIPEYYTLHNHRCEHLKFYKNNFAFFTGLWKYLFRQYSRNLKQQICICSEWTFSPLR